MTATELAPIEWVDEYPGRKDLRVYKATSATGPNAGTTLARCERKRYQWGSLRRPTTRLVWEWHVERDDARLTGWTWGGTCPTLADAKRAAGRALAEAEAMRS